MHPRILYRAGSRPKVNEYLTDEKQLVQVLGFNGDDVLAENAADPIGSPGPLLQLEPEDLKAWRIVTPAGDGACRASA